MLYIYEWVNPPSPTNRYRIVETYHCVDGIRSRLTDRTFATLEEAKSFVANPVGGLNPAPKPAALDQI